MNEVQHRRSSGLRTHRLTWNSHPIIMPMPFAAPECVARLPQPHGHLRRLVDRTGWMVRVSRSALAEVVMGQILSL